MTKIESINSGVFAIDGIPYQKGQYELRVEGQDISILRVSNAKQYLIGPIPVTDWTNKDDVAYADVNVFINDMQTVMFKGKDVEYLGSSITDSQGLAELHMTDDGLSTGNYLYIGQDLHILAQAEKDTTELAEMPFISFKRRHNEGVTDEQGKSIEVQVLESEELLGATQGLERAPAGVTVRFYAVFV